MTKHVTIDNRFALDRRDFLKRSSAGLVVCFTLGEATNAAQAGVGAMLGAYIQIAPDNTITIYIGASEMGQGIMTGMAQLAAEELMVDWSTVRAEHAPANAAYANPLFHAQLTGGSTSMRGWFTPMRQAAAVAREMLRAAGAAALGQPVANCTARGGAIWSGTASVPYAQIVAQAAALPPPDPATIPLVSNFKIIGQRLARTDIPAKVNGSAIFGIDVRLPGMLHATVVHCPTLGGTVAVMPPKPGNAIAIVNLGNAVGVVANDTWTAMGIANQLRVQWSIPAASAALDTATMLGVAQGLVTSTTVQPQVPEQAGAPDAALASAAARIDATYQLPYLAHACMEVLNCTAYVTSTSCEIWAPTQGQAMCVPTAMAITGLPASAITVHTMFLGGGLGRKFEQDFIAQAITIAKAVGKPVKMTWSRTQDFRNDKFRPSAQIRVQAGLDQNGALTSLVYRNVSPSITQQRNTTPGTNPEDTGAVAGALGLPYAIANRRIEFVPDPAAIVVGYWRSVGESYNTFAVESAIDELALAAGRDPMAFRRGLLANSPRGLAVLDAVAQISGWATAPARGHARGVAFLSGFGSYIAIVAEITVDSLLRASVKKVFCAIDCGTAVNPDSVEAQMQSGIAHGVSATLWGQATFTKGAPDVGNFNKYRLLRMGEMPAVTVQIVNSGGPIGGIGETGVPCVAPAIANAYAKLTGTRLRSLPFYPGATMGD